MTTRAELQAIMDAPGFGRGRGYLEQKAQEAEALALLPNPKDFAPVRAASGVDDWFIASFGSSSDDGKDWYLTTDSVRASELADAAFPCDAKIDAHAVAAIINCYRMGLLVLAARQEPPHDR
jgi:hypothetical protein